MEFFTSNYTLITLLGGAFGWFWTQTRNLDRRVARIESSLAVLEERLRHMPDSRDFTRLSEQLARSTASNEALAAECARLSTRIDRIEDWASKEGA